ncbi:hypothetical protein TREES_T100010406 [Tupaia chinensis]|uniref:Uncharacterized protein n=1 Tax=Tupaia chinensis TaxID=246437 RepID=L9LFQ0_TUPCH|nr:hypothetical protein TREES_T100010406 [Tupaia chinensis]
MLFQPAGTSQHQAVPLESVGGPQAQDKSVDPGDSNSLGTPDQALCPGGSWSGVPPTLSAMSNMASELLHSEDPMGLFQSSVASRARGAAAWFWASSSPALGAHWEGQASGHLVQALNSACSAVVPGALVTERTRPRTRYESNDGSLGLKWWEHAKAVAGSPLHVGHLDMPGGMPGVASEAEDRWLVRVVAKVRTFGTSVGTSCVLHDFLSVSKAALKTRHCRCEIQRESVRTLRFLERGEDSEDRPLLI